MVHLCGTEACALGSTSSDKHRCCSQPPTSQVYLEATDGVDSPPGLFFMHNMQLLRLLSFGFKHQYPALQYRAFDCGAFLPMVQATVRAGSA